MRLLFESKSNKSLQRDSFTLKNHITATRRPVLGCTRKDTSTLKISCKTIYWMVLFTLPLWHISPFFNAII